MLHRIPNPELIRFLVLGLARSVADEGTPDVAWTSRRRDTLRQWTRPLRHRSGRPHRCSTASRPNPGRSRVPLAWDPLSSQPERRLSRPTPRTFLGTGISDVHPRITAGVTAHGALLLLVIDGRQDASRGVSLDELAKILWALAAAEAVNLDGGSSAVVVNSRLLNRPTGGTTERAVASALIVGCKAL